MAIRTYEWTGADVRECEYHGPLRRVAVFPPPALVVSGGEEALLPLIGITYRIEEAHILRDRTAQERIQAMFPSMRFIFHNDAFPDARLYLPRGEQLQLVHEFAVACDMGWPGAAGLLVHAIVDALFGWL
jgi:hypothetical protein